MNVNDFITVSDLSSFIYCKRKFFLNKVYEIKEKPTKREATGTIAHSLIEKFSSMQGELAEIISKDDDYKSILFKIHSKLNDEKRKIIRKFKDEKRVDEEQIEKLSSAMKKIILKESLFYARLFNDFVSESPIFGDDLKRKVIPKILGEEDIMSESLKIKGRIDRIIDYGKFKVAVEYKTSFRPAKIWNNQKMQIGTYILMLNEKNRSEFKRGFLIYLMDYSTVNINFDNELEKMIKNTNLEIRRTISSSKIPERINSNKCKTCGIREYCLRL